METAEYTLVIINLAAGFGCAIPVARCLSKVDRNQEKVFRYFAMLIGIYFIECTFLVMGMGIPVLNVGLAFVWGVIFGLWLRGRASEHEVLRTAFFLSIYSSLPAVSFIFIPVIVLLSGWNILSPDEGARFGIPDFFPFPLSSILGFYGSDTAGAVVYKTVITTGEVCLLYHPGKKKEVGNQGS